MRIEQEISLEPPALEKLPKSKTEIEKLLVVDLRSYAGCETAAAIVVVPVVGHDAKGNWTVACFDAGHSDGDACDRALQHIVPRLQRIYELVQKH